MTGKVIFTNDRDYELSRIQGLSRDFSRKFYVYGKDFENLAFFIERLTDFTFLNLKDTFDPRYSAMISCNSASDFFVLKYPRLNDIMNRNIGMYQENFKGYKLVIDNHPFLEKRDVYWCYFLWSFFDKSLLGYPHCYAFRAAKIVNGIDPFDCSIIAKKVSGVTETTIKEIFSNDLKIEHIVLDNNIKEEYQEVKKRLFETDRRPWIIVRKLKKFVNDRYRILNRG